MTFRAGMRMRMRFFLNRVQERLWVKPLLYCLLSVAAAFLAGLMDHLVHRFQILHLMPRISLESVQTLLSIIAASMLGMAVFAVGSMVSAFQAAGASATPRAFSLIIADDVSQKALSTFIGAFIFSVVGISALSNGYYDASGHLALFLMTLVVLLLVILRFLQWVDRIARLGRVGETIAKVEAVTAPTLRALRRHPRMGGVAVDDRSGLPLETSRVGYLQRIDMAELQDIADREDLHLRVKLLPGSLVAPGRSLVEVLDTAAPLADDLRARIEHAFVIGDKRTFDEDPRFGLIVLSQIASRALSRRSTIPAPRSTSSAASCVCSRCGRAAKPLRRTAVAAIRRRSTSASACRCCRSAICSTTPSMPSPATAQRWSKWPSACSRSCAASARCRTRRSPRRPSNTPALRATTPGWH